MHDERGLMWRRGRRVSVMLVLAVMTLGLLGSWTLYAMLEGQEQAHAASAMDRRVEVIESAVTAEMLRYVETSGDLAAGIGAQSELSAARFTALTANLDRYRLPGASGASLVVPATTREIPQVQREWRGRGNKELVLAPVEAKYEHLFVVLNRPLDGTPVQTGRDLSEALEPTEAMAASRRFRKVVASASYVLLKDRGLEESQQQQSFVLAAPIIGGVGTPREGVFQGWLLMGMRGHDFIGETMLQSAQGDVAVTLVDNSTPTAARVPLTRVSPSSLVEGTGLERTADIKVAGRTWQLQVQPTARFVDSLGPSLSTMTGSGGVLVTLLLAVLVGTLSTSRNRALAKVDNATTALRDDIERRELVEEALREANVGLTTANSKVADLVAMVSHDLRTPLAVLMSYSEMALEFWPEMTQEEQLDFVRKVSKTGNALHTMLEDTLSVSALDGDGVAPRQASVRVDEAVRESLAALPGPAPDVDLEGLEPIMAVVDPGHLGQVLTNLFTNAIKYGGDRFTVTSHSDGDHALVRISDSGPGVPASFVPHLFDRFTRSEDARVGAQKGTGLGLYIARSLLLANGGDITYETSPGGGATFCLHLPRIRKTADLLTH